MSFFRRQDAINLRIFIRPFMNNASKLFWVSIDFRGLQYRRTRFTCSHHVSFHQFCYLLADGLNRMVQHNRKPSSCDDYLYSTIDPPFNEGGQEETPKAASLLRPASSSRRRFSGWRAGVTACAVAAMISLLLNVGVAIGVAIKFGMPNGIGTLFHGSCKKVESLNFWIHLGINALSTILLGGLKLILVRDPVTTALTRTQGATTACNVCLHRQERRWMRPMPRGSGLILGCQAYGISPILQNQEWECGWVWHWLRCLYTWCELIFKRSIHEKETAWWGIS